MKPASLLFIFLDSSLYSYLSEISIEDSGFFMIYKFLSDIPFVCIMFGYSVLLWLSYPFP